MVARSAREHSRDAGSTVQEPLTARAVRSDAGGHTCGTFSERLVWMLGAWKRLERRRCAALPDPDLGGMRSLAVNIATKLYRQRFSEAELPAVGQLVMLGVTRSG